MYFRIVSSLDRLVGEYGILRLPNYIFDEFVEDDSRKECIRRVIEEIKSGGRVLICGPAGCGKTALMAVVLKELFNLGYRIGYIIDGEAVLNAHEDEGIVLFSDDIPRMSENTLRSIVQYNAGMIVATARREELDVLRRKMEADPLREFIVIEIGPMSSKYLSEILARYAKREGIDVYEDAINIVIQKAEGLPVYIWQLIRDMKINNVRVLTKDFASKIPIGMLDYVDDILWRILGENPERKEILLTLRIMADMPEYKMHQDLFNAVFVECKRAIYDKEFSIKKTLLSDLLDRICRYLARTYDYSFKLPHDAWRDVLIGKSQGLMSGEISRINSAFPQAERQRILYRAIEKAYKEIIEHTLDIDRKEAFIWQVEAIAPEILDKIQKRPKTTRIGTQELIEGITVRRVGEEEREIPAVELHEVGPFRRTTFIIRKKKKFLGLLIEKFEIFDNNGVFLGTMNVKIGIPTTTITVFDEDDVELWQIRVVGRRVEIYDKQGNLHGSITKSLFSNEYTFLNSYNEMKYIIRREGDRFMVRDINEAPVASILIGQKEDYLNIIRGIDEITAISIVIAINFVKL